MLRGFASASAGGGFRWTGRIGFAIGSAPREARVFRRSSVVEQLTVNQLVVGSNPTAGAKIPNVINKIGLKKNRHDGAE